MGQATTRSHDCDVLVVGGGPAGSTIAALLAERDWRVSLVEREHHPRFHIGESLLPMNLPIFERLGVLEEVAAIGVKKHGADFTAAPARGEVSYPFEHALRDSPGHAYQVPRAELDELLFRHAVGRGAAGYEGTTIHRLRLGEDGVQAEGRDDAQRPIRFRSRYLVDASGRGTLVGRQLDIAKRKPRRKTAALFGHFRHVVPADNAALGNIRIHRIARGWIWVIPLPGDITSVGVVCEPKRLQCPADQMEGRLRALIAEAPRLAPRLGEAELVGPPRRASNYSYRHAKIAGRRWIMVGDAFGFLDPVFSSGVYLAMKSAELATDVVDGALRHPARERRLQAGYQRTMRSAMDSFEWFIDHYNTDAMDLLFQQPNNKGQIVQAIISMLAGDVFDAPEVHRRLLGFKIVYGLTQLDALRIRISDKLKGESRWEELIGNLPPQIFTP